HKDNFRKSGLINQTKDSFVSSSAFANREAALKRFAVPVSKICRHRVGGLREVQKHLPGILGFSDLVVHQDKALGRRVIKCLARQDRSVSKSFGLGRSIAVVGRAVDVSASRPEAQADHLMRVSLARDQIGSWTLGRTAARKARDRQIKASPEKLNG